jgi:predicted RNA binding protein with dsRBD fold (UPF0201 family)
VSTEGKTTKNKQMVLKALVNVLTEKQIETHDSEEEGRIFLVHISK